MGVATNGKKRNILIFLVALFGALLLWMYAIGYDTEIDETTFTGIPVELIGLRSDGFSVAERESFSLNVDVRVSGTRAALNNVSASDFRAYVDISGVSSPGYQTLPIKVVPPNGLSVSESGLSVQNVTLYIDEFTTKTISIHFNVKHDPSPGLEIGEKIVHNENGESVDPMIRISGPAGLINDAEAFCEFDLGELSGQSIRATGEIQLRDAGTKQLISNPYISFSDNLVDVEFVLYEKKSVPITLFLQGGLYAGEDLQANFSLPNVMLYGPASELDSINALRLYVDESQFSDRTKITGSVMLSDLIDTNFANPKITASQEDARIDYEIILPSIRNKKINIPGNRIVVDGAPANFDLQCEPLEIRLIGSSKAISTYNVNQLTVRISYADLQQSADGSYVAVARITTGDSGVCVDGNYTVRLTKK